MRLAAALACAGAAGHLVPSVLAIPPLRRRMAAAVGGVGAYVALTFDDGPDPDSTPKFLDLLDAHDTRATFFLLGSQLASCPDLGRRIVTEGHEVGAHGWSHRTHLLRSPAAVAADLRRACDYIAAVTGVAPRYWRPPHGIPTGAGLLAARRMGMVPALWTTDGRDWRADATPGSVAGAIGPQLRPGAVVLLHDSDRFAASQAWTSALGAVPRLLRDCAERGLSAGPLGGSATARERSSCATSATPRQVQEDRVRRGSRA